MDFIDEITGEMTPFTLSAAVELMTPDGVFPLTERLGKNVETSVDDIIAFEMIKGVRELAPMGHRGDPSSRQNYSKESTLESFIPPQISIFDEITASQLVKLRTAGKSPINMTQQDKASALEAAISKKQKGLLNTVARRVEWLFAQTLMGMYVYENPETNRKFTVDFKVPKSTTISLGKTWDAPDSNPIRDIKTMIEEYYQANGLAPDLILLGKEAGAVFQTNKSVEDWMKSPGQTKFVANLSLRPGAIQPLGTIQGNDEILQYSAMYDEKRKPTPYIDSKYVFITNSELWKLYYAVISNFNVGGSVAATSFSQMIKADNGEKMTIELRSYPLPVLLSNMAVFRAKVV